MIKIEDPKDCCGCTACASICIHDAITMKPDALGFLYPEVDVSKCIDCGLCDKACQFSDQYDTSLNLDIPIAYAARHKDPYHLLSSRSGGAFVALSDYILERNGVVYGAGWTDELMVVHKRGVTKDDRNTFKGSKYTQSDMRGIFKQVKQDLISGKEVLFSGTGCQVAGLKGFLQNRKYENLYLVDIVCHGVPSPFIWRDYLNFIERKEKKKIIKADFRDKSEKGWKSHFESFTFVDGQKKYTSLYRQLFYAHLNLRWSCYNCHYCNTKRTGDISLADYWGWQRTDPNFNSDNKGCSLVLCNTDKGILWFEAVKDRMNTIRAELPNVMQNHLIKPSDMHPKRMLFEKNYAKNGFEYAMHKCGMMGWRYQLKIVKKRAKKFISRIKKWLIK